MKSLTWRHIALAAAVSALALAITLAVWTGLTQHQKQQTKLKKLHLQQIRLAVKDYLRDHPGEEMNWPVFFVAGQRSGTIWCPSKQSEAPVWDLAGRLKDYLYQFPVDPSEEVPGVSLYYFERRADEQRLGSCTEPDNFSLTL